MRVIVCVKQVPETSKIQIDPETGTLIREGVPAVLNPDDRNALEAALRLKETHGGHVTAVTMGPPQARAVLREAYAMGADRVILVTDPVFAGSDSWATARILAAVVKKTGPYDVILCGRQSIDGETAHVGPEIAEFLDIPQVTCAKKIQWREDHFVITRITDGVDYIIEAKPPLLLTAIQELNNPRHSPLDRFFEAFGEGIVETLSAADAGFEPGQAGFAGSPTEIYRSTPLHREKRGEIIRGESVRDQAVNLMKKLKEVNML
ncbi:MAG: electron transfer flavoprotein subunit beta/FixA family protein [Fusobacteriaceae bacterium]|jgi:electron transfer flavoprotein beta subunit|nr:electron transfer flavoprotein subunit beta/FixA family protein [Fusobacteriaceae bacterium]